MDGDGRDDCLARNQKPLNGGDDSEDRLSSMVLNPLAEVRIGMFMPIVICRGQLMVHAQRRCKGHDRQQQQNEGMRGDARSQTTQGTGRRRDRGNHRGAGP